MKITEFVGFLTRFKDAEVTELKGSSIEDHTTSWGRQYKVKVDFTIKVADEE